MNLNEAKEETHKVISKMPPPAWGPYQRMGDLVEEVGELANAIQRVGKQKNELSLNLLTRCVMFFSRFLAYQLFTILI